MKKINKISYPKSVDPALYLLVLLVNNLNIGTYVFHVHHETEIV